MVDVFDILINVAKFLVIFYVIYVIGKMAWDDGLKDLIMKKTDDLNSKSDEMLQKVKEEPKETDYVSPSPLADLEKVLE